MIRKTLISTLACVAMMTCGTAFAQKAKLMSGPYHGPLGPVTADSDSVTAAPFYTNLVSDPCNAGFKYDINNGFLVLGPNNCGLPGSTQWLAEPFIAGHSGTVARVMLAITNWSVCTPTSNKFTVAIYDTACTAPTLPNVQLGTAQLATSPAAPPALASANFATAGVTLTQGQKYWVVVTTSTQATQNATTAVWWEAVTSFSDPNFNDGNGWQAGPVAAPGGFQVQ
jgi:hypothetical protein